MSNKDNEENITGATDDSESKAATSDAGVPAKKTEQSEGTSATSGSEQTKEGTKSAGTTTKSKTVEAKPKGKENE